MKHLLQLPGGWHLQSKFYLRHTLGMQRGFGMVPVIILVSLVVITAWVFYQLGRGSAEKIAENEVVPSASVTYTEVREVASPSASVSTKGVWEKYSYEGFSFDYPASWIVTSEINDYVKGPYITIEDPMKKVMIEIASPEGYPFGFGGPDNKVVNNEFSLSVNGIDYKVTEVIRNDEYSFVHLTIPRPKPVAIVFGVGYPTHSRGGTLADYQQHKETMIKIVESLKF